MKWSEFKEELLHLVTARIPADGVPVHWEGRAEPSQLNYVNALLSLEIVQTQRVGRLHKARVPTDPHGSYVKTIGYERSVTVRFKLTALEHVGEVDALSLLDMLLLNIHDEENRNSDNWPLDESGYSEIAFVGDGPITELVLEGPDGRRLNQYVCDVVFTAAITYTPEDPSGFILSTTVTGTLDGEEHAPQTIGPIPE